MVARSALASLKNFKGPPCQIPDSSDHFGIFAAALDEEEDILMVKPATLYLDVIAKLRDQTKRPIAAYHVSGEYAMVMTAAQYGFRNIQTAMLVE